MSARVRAHLVARAAPIHVDGAYDVRVVELLHQRGLVAEVCLCGLLVATRLAGASVNDLHRHGLPGASAHAPVHRPEGAGADLRLELVGGVEGGEAVRRVALPLGDQRWRPRRVVAIQRLPRGVVVGSARLRTERGTFRAGTRVQGSQGLQFGPFGRPRDASTERLEQRHEAFAPRLPPAQLVGLAHRVRHLPHTHTQRERR